MPFISGSIVNLMGFGDNHGATMVAPCNTSVLSHKFPQVISDLESSVHRKKTRIGEGKIPRTYSDKLFTIIGYLIWLVVDLPL